jgi:Zn-dependent protease with chaperone function
MNFFQHQEAARGLTRRLVVLFAAAVVAIVVAVDAVVVVLLTFAERSAEYQLVVGGPSQAHNGAIVVTSVAVLCLIAVASLYKTRMLSAGGGAVAISLGGERIPARTTDPLRKRLLNVVEEMAIASGVPVPEVYVLEGEEGINAFTAGHTPATAAITVTRGALENLNRSELQAVVAHEFSHVLNGDMRLNTRLMGLLFGILVIALTGQFALRIASRSGGRKNGGAVAALLAFAFAVMMIGYIGLLFGRLIQAAVARSRERLADASAVQFTRDPHGLRDALVKIGALASGSRLHDVDAEQVAHLLFAPGSKRWFATHPSLEARIRTLDPRFQPSEFAKVRSALLVRKQADEVEPEVSQSTTRDRLTKLVAANIAIAPAALSQLVAAPSATKIAIAQTLRASLPPAVDTAAHDVAGATAMLLALALDEDANLRAQQLQVIETRLGSETAERVRQSLAVTGELEVLQRQPALLHVLPPLRELTRDERTRLLACLNGLLQLVGAISVEKYALRKLAQVHLYDATAAPRPTGSAALQGNEAELALLLAVLAKAGHSDPQPARRAYEAGLQLLLPGARPEYSPPVNWAVPLDLALNKLDRLMPAAKELLLQALVKTIAHDEMLAVAESELLRAVCAALHCPVPPLVAAAE